MIARLNLLIAATALAATAAAPAIARDPVSSTDGRTVVDVPTTRVATSEENGTQVKVRAPSTKVDVDTNRRHVRIRVPYFNGDIRW